MHTPESTFYPYRAWEVEFMEVQPPVHCDEGREHPCFSGWGGNHTSGWGREWVFMLHFVVYI